MARPDPNAAQSYKTAIHLFKGVSYGIKEKFSEAVAELNKAININPRYAAAYYNRGLAYVKFCQFDKAISDYSKAIEINPKDAWAYNSRGIAFFFKR